MLMVAFEVENIRERLAQGLDVVDLMQRQVGVIANFNLVQFRLNLFFQCPGSIHRLRVGLLLVRLVTGGFVFTTAMRGGLSLVEVCDPELCSGSRLSETIISLFSFCICPFGICLCTLVLSILLSFL
jgi:hypothetical protein